MSWLYICAPGRRITTMQYDLFDTVRSLDNVPDAFWKIEYDEINDVKKCDVMLALKNAFAQTALLVTDLAGGLTNESYSRYMTATRELRELHGTLVSLTTMSDECEMYLIPHDIAATLQEF
jgi:hypothetical protein